MNHLGENIRLVREQLGLSTHELARRARVGRAVIERYESGISTPDTLTILKLCTILDIPVSTITNRQENLQNHDETHNSMLYMHEAHETITNYHV